MRPEAHKEQNHYRESSLQLENPETPIRPKEEDKKNLHKIIFEK